MTENPAGIPIDQLSDGRVGVAVIAGPVVPDEPLGAANAQEVSETWLNLEIEAGEPIDLPAGEAYRTLVSWPALPPGEKATVYAIQSSEKTYFFVFLDEPAHRQVMETVALDG